MAAIDDCTAKRNIFTKYLLSAKSGFKKPITLCFVSGGIGLQLIEASRTTIKMGSQHIIKRGNALMDELRLIFHSVGREARVWTADVQGARPGHFETL